MKKQDLLIIGAGASGLMAAYELANHFHITILEAADRVGGRTNSFPIIGFPDFVFEEGAEFIHGELEVTLDLLRQAGIPYHACAGTWYHVRNGKLEEGDIEEEGWDELIDRMQQEEADRTLTDFLHKYYPEENKLTRAVKRFAAGFDLADPDLVSIKSLAKEWSADEMQNYRIKGGYGKLISWLSENIRHRSVRILTEQEVIQVNWTNEKVTVVTRKETFHANKLLITVPTPQIKYIEFNPTISAYQEAARDLAIGAVIKIQMLFDKPYWPVDTGFILSEEEIPTWWTQLPNNLPLLTGWCGGPHASALSELLDEEIVEKAIESLSNITGIDYSELQAGIREVHVFNWLHQPFIPGGYSYDTLKSTEAKSMLNRPIENTIFFAGEALYVGDHPGTVEAALVSGKDAARKLIG